MRVCVVGCGAVGSLFAANLATLDDVEVWAFDLNEAHVDAIKKNGLHLVRRRRGRRAPARDERSRPSCPPCDFGIVATKAMHADAAIAATAHAFADGAVASVMNGVGNEETLARHVERVIRGTTFPAGQAARAGHRAVGRARATRRSRPFEPRPVAGRGDRAARRRVHARRDARRTRSPTRRPAQWRKVIFNASTNPIGALTGLTHGRVCERPDLRALVSGLVAEGKAVAAAQGITLDADPEELIDHAAKPEVAYGHKASMLQDVEARRQTEIDFLNGGIARFGRELGVPTPLNDAITALIKGVEASWNTSTEPSSTGGTRTSGPRWPSTSSTRSSSPEASTRASREPSRTCPASRSCTATPTSSCPPTATRSSSSPPRRGTSASTGTAPLEQVFDPLPGAAIADHARDAGLEAARRLRPRLRHERARLPRARRLRPRAVRRRVRPRARRQERGRARERPRLGAHQPARLRALGRALRARPDARPR